METRPQSPQPPGAPRWAAMFYDPASATWRLGAESPDGFLPRIQKPGWFFVASLELHDHAACLPVYPRLARVPAREIESKRRHRSVASLCRGDSFELRGRMLRQHA